jgi:hypothetical protein
MSTIHHSLVNYMLSYIRNKQQEQQQKEKHALDSPSGDGQLTATSGRQTIF